MKILGEYLSSLQAARECDDGETYRERYSPDAMHIADLETRSPRGERYHWDGLRRGGDPERPFLLFQVTLDGYGCYESLSERREPQRIGVGKAFAAVIPGPHRYYLPDDATEPWTFFWIMLRHPYVAGRVREYQQRAPGSGAVLDLQPDSVLLARTVALFAGNFPDRFSEEAAVFDFLIEYERHVSAAAQAGGTDADEREAMLSRARALVLQDLARPLGVTDLARVEGISRTRYSHLFKAVTGQSPAHYVGRIRLEEVARRLAQTDATLSRIAEETGFADANHLCKSFRRRFQLSPGAYRRQMR